ncbi:MAG: hypothetical protein HN356_03605 [Calditrichaeota bacterium]|jgi:hypothetical protein|nr:hypothetical protein [Calditrichota bacterium]MBT7618144.1 hypothetical protein [Calditrichota bacterium]MBT7787497.1 hypothetical protein [Calditrichota bacterium]
MPDLRFVTPTISKLMGIEPPEDSTKETLSQVLELQKYSEPLERCLIYNPDATGKFLYDHDPVNFEPVENCTSLKLELNSIFPPKTPVCFASMYSGTSPQEHGITQYDKPVLEIDTLFDSVVEAGKKVAIVAVRDSSVALIFQDREIDYYSELYDPLVIRRAQKLIQADEHDLIVVYNQEYDDMLHKTTPFSKDCMSALKKHILNFVSLAKACDTHWDKYRRLISFIPDHGGHLNLETGKGDHGLDIDEDMKVLSFWDVK